MDLITAAREDLATRTTDELNDLLATDRTGLVAVELNSRSVIRYAGVPSACATAAQIYREIKVQRRPSYAEIIAQPNS